MVLVVEVVAVVGRRGLGLEGQPLSVSQRERGYNSQIYELQATARLQSTAIVVVRLG